MSDEAKISGEILCDDFLGQFANKRTRNTYSNGVYRIICSAIDVMRFELKNMESPVITKGLIQDAFNSDDIKPFRPRKNTGTISRARRVVLAAFDECSVQKTSKDAEQKELNATISPSGEDVESNVSPEDIEMGNAQIAKFNARYGRSS